MNYDDDDEIVRKLCCCFFSLSQELFNFFFVYPFGMEQENAFKPIDFLVEIISVFLVEQC